MEGYVNNDTLIENEVTKFLKAQLICPLCNNIFINPLMCMNCQKVYCKRCIDNSINKSKKCTCTNPNYQKCISKNDLLSQLKFICVGCEKEIKYDDAEKHHESCCPGKTSKKTNSTETLIETRIKRLKSEEMKNLKKQGIDYTSLNSN